MVRIISFFIAFNMLGSLYGQYNEKSLIGEGRPQLDEPKEFVAKIKEKANAILIDRLGKKYSDKMIDTGYKYQWYYDNVYFNTAPSENNYHVAYWLNRGTVYNTNFELRFDKTNLSLIDSIENYVPDCKNNPSECEFISEERARNITISLFNSKFKNKGSMHFGYEPSYKTYVWTYYASIRYNSTRGDEATAIIDANDGKVLKSKTENNVWMGRCLPANTMIKTKRGDVKVQELTLNDSVLTLDENGKKCFRPLVLSTSTPVSEDHRLVYIKLKDGRDLCASPGHPLSDNKSFFGNIKKGDRIDGSTVMTVKLFKYTEGVTYDLLTSGLNSSYFANGILIGSTLFNSFYGKAKK